MQQTVILFESDASVATTINSFLKERDFIVIHFSQFPADGIVGVIEKVTTPPFMVLMSVNIDGGSYQDFDHCQAVKQHSFFKSVPIIFISDSIDDQHLLAAYELGVYDYLLKPIQIQTLTIKCRQIQEFKDHTNELESQVNVSQQMAFDAMTFSSEIGSILRFHEKIGTIKTIEELAEAIVKQVGLFGVSNSVFFDIAEKVSYFSDDGKPHLLEQKIYPMLKNQGRVYSWNNRTLFNYDDFSVLVRSMPVADDARYGTLKDHFCLLLNGVENRVRGIINEQKMLKDQQSIRTVSEAIASLVVDMEQNNVTLSGQFERVMADLQVDTRADIAHLNLLDSEEKLLFGHLDKAIHNASVIFDQSKSKEVRYKKIMKSLLKRLTRED